jgi:hypothetical protein
MWLRKKIIYPKYLDGCIYPDIYDVLGVVNVSLSILTQIYGRTTTHISSKMGSFYLTNSFLNSLLWKLIGDKTIWKRNVIPIPFYLSKREKRIVFHMDPDGVCVEKIEKEIKKTR